MRQCTLDQNLLEPFELGAILYGLALFPQANDEHRWRGTSAALAARYVADQHKLSPSTWTNEAIHRPEYLARNNRSAISGLKQRSAKVMEVGAAMLVQLQHAITGVNQLDRSHSSKPSLRKLAGILRSNRTASSCVDATYKDFLKIYQAWQPAAHLAAAYRWQHDRTGAAKFRWDLGDVAFHRQTVMIANVFALALNELPHLPWRHSDPVWLTWIDFVAVQEFTPG